MTVYVVRTNLDPNALNALATEIFSKWMDFALGRASLGGKRLVYPTGRYARSLQFQRTGEASIAILADEAVAPEAGVLEYGHGPVDLKTRLQHGRAYPMHRYVGSTPGTTLRRRGSGPPGLKPSIWAEVRRREASGFASIGPQSDPGSWIIPAMPAYSPSLVLATLARRMTRGT